MNALALGLGFNGAIGSSRYTRRHEVRIKPRLPSASERLLDPFSDRLEIVKKHAAAAREFANDQLTAKMLGNITTAYSIWWNSGRKGKNPIFAIPVETVVAAMDALSIGEVRELKDSLLVICRIPDSCPIDFVEARDAANRRLKQIGF